MKKYFFLLSLSLLVYVVTLAQTDSLKASGKSNAVAVGLFIPIDVFARSHVAGGGIDYSWSRHRFGLDASVTKRIGFMLNSGINFYIGKKTTTAGYDFRYGNYIDLHATAGALYNPFSKVNISLTAGPALSIYKKNIRGAIGVILLGNYYLSRHIAIGPGIVFKKYSNTTIRWAGTIRASYVF